jgi:hypothetical protein
MGEFSALFGGKSQTGRLRNNVLHGLTTLYETRKLFRFETGTGLSQSTIIRWYMFTASMCSRTRTVMKCAMWALVQKESEAFSGKVSLFGNSVTESSLIFEGTSSSDNDGDYYILIGKLLDSSIFSGWWEPESPYRVPHWTQNTSNSVRLPSYYARGMYVWYDVLPKIFLYELHTHFWIFLICFA